MPFDPSHLAEREVERRIRNVTDDYLCSEILPEFDTRSDQFLSFLKAVREMDKYEIGDRFLAYLGAHFERQIDGDELAREADEDARAEAADARREARAA